MELAVSLAMDANEERSFARAPVWFEETPLKGSDFDQGQYITELSRLVPLDTICTQLDTYLSQLKLELVEVINAKYNDFVGLAGQLGGVEGAIVRMGKPLTDLKVSYRTKEWESGKCVVQKRLGEVERGVESELKLLEATLEHRQRVTSARKALQTMQNAIQISSKIDKLVLEVRAAFRTEDVSQQSTLLERVARELGRLDLLGTENKVCLDDVTAEKLTMFQELVLIKALIEEKGNVTAEIEARVGTCLGTVFAMSPAEHGPALRLLNACAALGRVQTGEAKINELLVKPFLRQIFEQEKDAKLLGPLLEKVMSGMDVLYSEFFPMVMENATGLQQYDFLGNCLLAAFHDQVSHSMPFVFSPGKPDLFLENYKLAMEFVEALEHRCKSIESLERFRNGSGLQRFMRAWNLPVYFAMRFQEIAGTLDSALDTEQIPVRGAEDGFLYRGVLVWMQCLQQCFNPQIATRDLMDQFLKLFFKLLSRFEQWLATNISSLGPTVESEKPSLAFPQKSEELIAFHCDLSKAQSVLETGFYKAGLELNCQEAVENLVMRSCSHLQSYQQKILQIVETRLLVECTAVIKKSVGTAGSTIFRPGGEQPTVPNDYVRRLMEPLQFFMESGMVETYVSAEVKAQLKRSVAHGVCRSYRQALEESLSFWEKSRMSLRRIINKGRLTVGGADSTEAGKGDELSKVYHQHWLDVGAFGQVLKDLGVEGLPEYRELTDLVISKKEGQEPMAG